jgi:tetratricopeptide (TPR) repeat protein
MRSAFAVIVFWILCVAVAGAQQPAARGPALSDRAAGELAKLRPLFEQQRNAELIAGLERVLPSLANPSHDRAIFFQAIAQAHVRSGNEQAAIRPIEQALSQGTLDTATAQEFRFFLAQLQHQHVNLSRALQTLEEWQRVGGAATREQLLYHGALLHEAGRNEQALERIRESLATPGPATEQQLMLGYSVLAALNRHEAAAEMLEVVVRMRPESGQAWQLLVQSYLSAQEPMRALVALERGMEFGHFASGRDYFTRLGLYYNLGHFARAIELIEEGFASGRLPAEKSNWELLAGSWIQLGDFRRAAEVYARASALVPGGDLDFARAQILYSEGDLEGALAATRTAWDKGRFEKVPRERVLRQLAGLAVEARDVQQLRFAVGRMRALNLAQELRDFEPWLQDLTNR